MSSTARSRKRRPQTPLSQERVLRAAVELADADGLGALSMRTLAKSLGVEAMSLYNHVANKDALLDGMIETVFAEIEPPSPDGDWKAELRERALSTRAALLRHPWAVGEMEGRGDHGPANMRIREAVLGCLFGAGFDEAGAVHAYSMLDSYTYGFALLQTDLSPQSREDFAAVARQQMDTYADAFAEHPNLARLVGGYVAEHGFDYEEQFDFGLGLILDGLERTLTNAR